MIGDSLIDPGIKPGVISSISLKCNSWNYNYNEITGKRIRPMILITDRLLASEKEEILLGDIYVKDRIAIFCITRKNYVPWLLTNLEGCLKSRTRLL